MTKVLSKTVVGSLLVGSFISPILAQQFVNDPLFKQGITAYKNKAYEKSYESLKKYLDKYGLDKRISFMLGRSAYELGKYEEALSAYEKVLFVDPKNTRTKLEMAQAYFKLENYEKAKEYFEEVLKEDVPIAVKRNIHLSLLSIKTKSQKHFFKSTLIASVGFDSNVNNSPNAGDYSQFLDDIGSSGTPTPKEKDETFSMAASLGHTYKISDIYALQNKFMAYSQIYASFKNKNIDVVAVGTALNYFKKDYRASLSLDYNHIWLDKKDYLNNFILKPAFNFKLSKKIDYEISLKVAKKDFVQSSLDDKDSTSYELSHSILYSTKDLGTNSLTLTIGKERKEKGARTDIDQDYYTFKYDNKYPLSKDMMLINTLSYESDEYKDKNALLNKERKDTTYSLSSSVVKSVNKNLALGAVLNVSKVNSNLVPYEYSKYSVKTNVFYSF